MLALSTHPVLHSVFSMMMVLVRHNGIQHRTISKWFLDWQQIIAR
jgi:hypothetical protein